MAAWERSCWPCRPEQACAVPAKTQTMPELRCAGSGLQSALVPAYSLRLFRPTFLQARDYRQVYQ